MHFGGSTRKYFCRGQIRINGSAREFKNRFAALVLVTRRLRAVTQVFRGGVIKWREGFQREAPCVSFIRHKLLQNTLHHLLSIAGKVLQRTRQGWNIGERSFFSDELADLKIRIDAFLNSSKEFEDQMMAINNGTVALLCPHRFWAQVVNS